MKNILVSIMFAFSLTTQAKTAAEMFQSMPDSIIPYMTADARKQIIDLKVIQPDSTATVTTATGTATLLALTDNILSVSLSKEIFFEIGCLDDNRYVVIKTYGAPKKESVVYLCDSLWQDKEPVSFLDAKGNATIDFYTDSATADTKKLVDFPLVEAHLVSDGDKKVSALKLKLNAPLLNADERKLLERYTRQRTVTWNGHTFTL